MTLKNTEGGFSQVTYKFRVQKGAHDFRYAIYDSGAQGLAFSWGGVDVQPWKQHHKWNVRSTAWLDGKGEVTIYKAFVTYTVDKVHE